MPPSWEFVMRNILSRLSSLARQDQISAASGAGGEGAQIGRGEFDVPSDAGFGFDAEFYRSFYSDLRSFSDEESYRHFLEFGFNERRFSNSVATREMLLGQISAEERILEIGPFASPRLRGGNVFYADYLSTAELKARAPLHGLNPDNCPNIHYVLKDTPLCEVDDHFSAVFSSHCIEHQPDLVRHFQDVGRLIPDGGCYYMVVPDKRYCFDHFIPESSLLDVVTAFAEGRKFHSLKSLISAHWLAAHNDETRHWLGDHGEQPNSNLIPSLVDAAVRQYRSAEATGEYVDVHAWQFTPVTFREIAVELYAMGLSSLYPVEVGPTFPGKVEFCAILRKQSASG